MSDTIFQGWLPLLRSRAEGRTRRIGVPVTNAESLQCDWRVETAALTEAARDYRAAAIRAFASRRIAPTVACVAMALTRGAKKGAAVLWTRIGAEQAFAARYHGRAWCDTTEAELNNDITTCHSQRF